jgi:hypothetical protein
MKLCRRIAILRRQVRQLTAIAAERRSVIRPSASFRSLTKSKTEAIVGELLAALAAGAAEHK